MALHDGDSLVNKNVLRLVSIVIDYVLCQEGFGFFFRNFVPVLRFVALERWKKIYFEFVTSEKGR